MRHARSATRRSSPSVSSRPRNWCARISRKAARSSAGISLDRMRARLEALLKANAAPRCGARSKRTGKPCRGAAMPNGRCKLHGGKSTGPRTAEGLARSRRANWKHGHFRGKPRRNGRACGRQYLRSAICATRSKGPRGPTVGYGPHRTIYLTGSMPARASARSRFRELTAR